MKFPISDDLGSPVIFWSIVWYQVYQDVLEHFCFLLLTSLMEMPTLLNEHAITVLDWLAISPDLNPIEFIILRILSRGR